MASVEMMRIEVIHCPGPGTAQQVILQLSVGSTVDDALQRSGLLAETAVSQADPMALGIWGKRCTPNDMLRDQDRVEIYRSLQVDPKEARRQRYKSHRAQGKP